MRAIQHLSIGVLIAMSSCSKPQIPDAPAAAAPQRTKDGSTAAIEEQLAPDDIAMSIDVATRDARGLPETIRVHYKNKSAKRGYFEFPTPIRGQLHSEYRAPSLAIGTRQNKPTDPGAEPFFLYVPPVAEQAARSSVAVLDPACSVVMQYSLAHFCLVGHGIAPDSRANFLTCYSPGNIKTEMRAYIVTNWDNFARVASDPVAMNLSELDSSRLPDMQSPK